MHLTLNQEVRPFVVLAERVGSLAAQLSSGKLKSITMGATGEIVISSFELLKAGALKGILSHTVPEPVNFISAPFLASEMGITVNETRDAAGESFSNLFRIRYETEREIREIAGTVIGTSTPRLVMLDGFRFEVRPEGYLLVYNNIDRPGILARIGGILAKYNVNIAGVSLGRSRAGGNALTVMNIDSTIPGEGMKELIAQDGVSNLRLARLD
jgi:D-3-phosphoglycerate dehydrogenase